ncbi:MAG: spinster family MFS transporter [Alphaproteobacteria bacterium]
MAGVNDTGPGAGPGDEVFEGGYRSYALGLLTVVYTMNFVDRQILSILDEPIKNDLGLLDQQIGLLHGAAFAIFYSICGLFIAAWADRTVRKNIIAGTLAIFSAMTIVCGLAQNFLQLFLARVGVGIGEAGTSPPAHSIISDLYGMEQRATAMAVYGMGINFGTMLGIYGAGYVYEVTESWRMGFLVAGVPGLILAVIVWLTLREPPRGYSERAARPGAADEPQATLVQTAAYLWNLRSFRFLSIGAMLNAFAGYGATSFYDNFLIRSHNFTVGEVKDVIAIGLGIVGGVGTFFSGYIVDRLARLDMRWSMWFPAATILMGVPFTLGFYFYPDKWIAIALAAFPVFFGVVYLAPSLAVSQRLAKLSMRAKTSAVLFLIINLIGYGVGPWAVGRLSDFLNFQLGYSEAEALRYSLAILVTSAGALSGLCFFIASLYLRKDLKATAH